MSWFGKSTESIPFKVWKTRAEQLKGMGTEAMSAVRNGSDALVVTFFEARRAECRTFFQQKGIPFLEVTNGSPVDKTPSIYLLAADRIDVHVSTSLRDPAILFYGLYPLPGREEEVAAKFPDAKSKQSFSSLEDPLFKAFGMENIVTILESLGLKDGECIEHKFVDKAIANAQKKLGVKVRTENAASSEEEWFQKNIAK